MHYEGAARPRGELHVTWEEGLRAAWLYNQLKPHVQRVLVCDPRRNALLKEGNKSDKIDTRKLLHCCQCENARRRPDVNTSSFCFFPTGGLVT